MDDPVAVGRAQALRDLHQDRPGALPVHRPALLEGLPEVLTVEKLHRDEHQPLRRLPEVGDVDDVLVADPRRALRLLQEPLDQVGPPRQILEQDLERHPLLDERVLGLVDGAHPALADLADDSIPIRQHLADQRIVSRWAGIADGHTALNLSCWRSALHRGGELVVRVGDRETKQRERLGVGDDARQGERLFARPGGRQNDRQGSR